VDVFILKKKEMIILKIKKTKRLAILLLTSFVLTGCSPHKENVDIIVENTNEEIITEKQETEEIIENGQNTERENQDEIINDYIEELETTLNNISENDTVETIKEKLTTSFITLVDFIFYEEDISGIKFNDLTEENKKIIIDDFILIDSLIDKYFPEYKENLSKKYDNLSEKTTNLLKEKLGEENWDKLGESKDEFINSLNSLGDVLEDLTESGKIKIKDWYEKFKNNNP